MSDWVARRLSTYPHRQLRAIRYLTCVARRDELRREAAAAVPAAASVEGVRGRACTAEARPLVPVLLSCVFALEFS